MNCFLCNSDQTSCLFDSRNIFLCKKCNHAFRVDDHSKTIEQYSKKVLMPGIFESIIQNRHHFNFITKYVNIDNINTVLEIGCGNGSFIKYFKKCFPNIDIYVLEPSKIYSKRLSEIKGITVFNTYVEDIKLEKKFDLILMSHVLEHLISPYRTLSFIFDNLLQKNGFLYIDIPNKDYELRNENAAIMAPQTHLFFFDAENIKKDLISIGFKKEYSIYEKYATLPKLFLKNMERIAILGFKNKRINKFNIILLKIRNKFIVKVWSFILVVLNSKPRIITTDIKSPFYNNIAIITQK